MSAEKQREMLGYMREGKVLKVLRAHREAMDELYDKMKLEVSALERGLLAARSEAEDTVTRESVIQGLINTVDGRRSEGSFHTQYGDSLDYLTEFLEEELEEKQ